MKQIKRQHPTDVSLFWCPKCQTYKKKGDFAKRAKDKNGIQSRCKKCNNNLIPRYPRIEKNCLVCGGLFPVKPSQYDIRKTCDRKCQAKYYSGKIKGRQKTHLSDKNLIWCSNCKTFKIKECYGKRKNRLDGLSSWCTECNNRKSSERYYTLDKDVLRKKSRERRKLHPEVERAKRKRDKIYRPEKIKAYAKKAKAKAVKELKDHYLISNMKRCGMPITKETVELKRQHILMQRTLKQFKEWREENEHTDYRNVQTEQ